jgi:hypothetical protein
LLLLMVSVNPLHGQDDETLLTTGAGWASARVFRGVERSGAATQAFAGVAGDGLSGKIWTSQPFNHGVAGETDLEIGYSGKISTQFALEATATQFLFEGGAAGATRQSTEAGLKASWISAAGLKASLAVFHDFRLRMNTVETAAGYSLPLKSLGAYLELDSFAGWADGTDLLPDATLPRVRDGYAYFGAEARLPYRVGRHTTVEAGLHFSDAIGQSRSWSPTGHPGGAHSWASFAVNFDF